MSNSKISKIQKNFNVFLLSAIEKLPANNGEVMASARYNNGLFDVRLRANPKQLQELDNAAKSFAQSQSPPLTINFC